MARKDSVSTTTRETYYNRMSRESIQRAKAAEPAPPPKPPEVFTRAERAQGYKGALCTAGGFECRK